MSESYIVLHKPEPLVTTTPKRKSVGNSNVTKTISPEKLRAQTVFHDFELKLDAIKKKIHHELFDSVSLKTVEYFQYYLKKRSALESYESATQKSTTTRMSLAPGVQKNVSTLHLNPLFKIIPTIALFTGINTQDFANLYESLLQGLKKELTRHVFVLNEKNTSNMKSVLNSICTQWESDTENTVKFAKKNILTIRHLFDSIILQNGETNVSDRNRSVVFIFKQFELIPKETIENLIILISNQIEKLPVFLVFESASQTSIVNEQLNCQAISKLCIKQLNLTSTANLLDTFLTELFIESTFPFKVSGEILKQLLDVYNDVNFSLESFIHSIKFCFYDHLKSDESVAELFEAIDQNEGAVSNDRQLVWLARFNTFVFTARLLHEILTKFPVETSPDSLFNADYRRFNMLFARVWHDCSRTQTPANFVDSSQYMALRKLLRLSSTNTFDLIVQGLLEAIVTKLEANPLFEPSFVQQAIELGEFLQRFKISMGNDLAAAGGKGFNKASPESLELKEAVIDKLHAVFSIYLSHGYIMSPDEAKLFVYDNFATFKKRLFDVQRFNIHSCLLDSIGYMKTNYNLHTESDETPRKRLKNMAAKLPCFSFKNESTQVLSYAYQIYLECGHMINLHDWLLAFVERLENEDLTDLDENTSSLLQALFFRSITELQFMGLIKPTSRKVDHVIKLTNGKA